MKSLFLPLFLTMPLFAAQIPDLPDRANLSFEAGAPGEAPRGWAFPGNSNVLFTLEAQSPHPSAGQQSLYVDYRKATKEDHPRLILSEFLPIEPGRSYVQSCWLQTDGQTPDGFGVSVGRLYFDENKELIEPKVYHDRYLIANAGNQGWERYRVVLTPSEDEDAFRANTIPQAARYVRLAFVSYGYDKTYRIDDHRFEPLRETGEVFNESNLKVTTAEPIPGPITLDGRLNEAFWKPESTPFVRSICEKEESLPVQNQTRFQILQDEQFVYFGIRAYGDGEVMSRPRENQSMDLFSDESVDVVLDATGQRRTLYQFAVNPDGALTELFYDLRSAGAQAAATRLPDGWSAEVRLPKKGLEALYREAGLSVSPTRWNFNLSRLQPGKAAQERFSSWNYTRSGFNVPDPMGLLLLAPAGTVLEEAADQAAQALKTKEPLPESVRAELEALGEWVERLRQPEPEVPLHLFARYLSELDAIPAAGASLLAKAQQGAFPPERESAGYYLYAQPLLASTEEVRPGALLERHEVRLAGGEIHSSRFSLYSKKELKEVHVTAGRFQHEDGETLAAEKLDLRILLPWGADRQADLLATDTRVPLEGWLERYANHPRVIGSVPANQSAHLLFQVDARGVKPGRYEGSVRLAPEGAEATELPVVIEVLPFELPATPRRVGFFYSGVLFDPSGPEIGSRSAIFYNGLTTPEAMEREFALLADTGFNFVVVPAYAGGPLEAGYVEKLISTAAKVGLRQVAMTGGEHLLSPRHVAEGGEKLEAAKAALTQRVAAIGALAKAHGVEVYLYGADEPNDEVHVTANNLIFEIAHAAGLKTMVAIMRDDIRQQVRGIDLLSMNWILMTLRSSLLDAIGRGEGHGYEAATFYANLTARFQSVVRLTNGWYLYKSKMNGSVPWGYYYLGQEWEPFLDRGVGYIGNCAYYVFPTKDEPIATLKFIASHEGLNDLRYLEKLDAALAATPNAEVQRELDEMLATFSVQNPRGIHSDNFAIAPEVYDQYRARLQTLLLKLLPAAPVAARD